MALYHAGGVTVQLLSCVQLFVTPWTAACQAPLSSTAAAAKSLQSCPTLCDPIDGSPPGSPVPGILQARTLEWVAISFSNAWKGKVKVKSLSRVRLLATSWTAAYQAPPSMGFSRQEYWSGLPLPSPTSWNLLKFVSIRLVMLSNHPILCRPFLLLPSVFPSVRAFFSESALRIKWPKYWSFSLSISPSNEYSGLILLELTGLITLQSTELLRISSITTVWKHKFFSAQPSLWSSFHTWTWLLEKPYLWLYRPLSAK